MRSPRTAMKSSPCSLQLEKAFTQQRRPNADKNLKKKKINCEKVVTFKHAFQVWVGEEGEAGTNK